MTTSAKNLSLRLAAAALIGGTAASFGSIALPVAAQETPAAAEARLKKIEAEVRALQRKVFPGGDGKFFEPQITPGTQGAAQTPAPTTGGVPAATAVTDILVRIDALEAQLQRLTARSEEQANALAQLELRLAALETKADTPLPDAGTGAAAPAIQPAATLTSAGTGTTTQSGGAPATTTRPPVQTPPPAATTAATVAAPSPSRLAAVQAITKPQTADAGDDEYSYGFRLWNAGFFPEARQQLTKYVEQYPTHSKISYGRNLLGRAFLDDKMPEDAARWFLKNYQANKAGERAPDSLLYLGASMVAMKDTKRACIALAEFAETYPLVAAGRLATEYQTTRAKVKCS
ncbi:tetratricopeptide repeat protein [Erythrobacter oryzae]|uniref:tetratricopeptide repeat protein n=1 Tax=Erythrobacter oryzae TaxID=3019556 RepID=UPI002552494F|nr:tetratricopeptide repeat protein [Erythrobacter sp. COR-2]